MLKQKLNTTPSSHLLLALALAGLAVLLWQPPYLEMGLPLRAALLWTNVQSGSAVVLIMACLFQMLVVPEWRRWRTGRMTGSETEDLFLGPSPGWHVLLGGLDRGQNKKLRPK